MVVLEDVNFGEGKKTRFCSRFALVSCCVSDLGTGCVARLTSCSCSEFSLVASAIAGSKLTLRFKGGKICFFFSFWHLAGPSKRQNH